MTLYTIQTVVAGYPPKGTVAAVSRIAGGLTDRPLQSVVMSRTGQSLAAVTAATRSLDDLVKAVKPGDVVRIVLCLQEDFVRHQGRDDGFPASVSRMRRAGADVEFEVHPTVASAPDWARALFAKATFAATIGKLD